MDVAALDAALTTWRTKRAGQAKARARIARSTNARRYWEARAVVKTFEDRLGACGATGRACDCCGAPIVRFCNARLVCPGCGKRAWKRAGRRIAAALKERQEGARQAWRRMGCPPMQEPRLALVTLTIAHSGDVRADRRLLSEAWHRWRAWYREHYAANLEYAWAPEYTPGNDDRGHVHMHVATFLPWRDYGVLREAWERATEGQGQRIHVSAGRTRDRRSGRLHTPKSAAKYLAKYMTKGAAHLSTEHAAKWIEAQHGMRAVSTSRHFWLPEVSQCPGATDGRHRFPAAWLDVAGWTPSYERATAPIAGPAGGNGPTPPLPRAGPAVFSGPAQLALPAT